MSAPLLRAPGAIAARSFLLSDWVTVSGGSTVTTVTQDPDQWLELPGFAEATFFIDIAQVTNPTSGVVALYLETAPFPDETYFTRQPLVGAIQCAATTSPLVLKTASMGAVPLCRYVRWRVKGTTSNTWNVTFRIRAVANRSFYFAPPTLGGCVFWARADLGVDFSGLGVQTWADQSTSTDPNKLLTTQSATRPTQTLLNSTYGNQTSISFVRASSTYMTSNVWASTLNQADTWVIVGNTVSNGLGEACIDANDRSTGQNIGRNPANAISIASAGTALTWANTWSGASAVLAEFNSTSSKIFYNDFTTAKATGNAGSGGTSGQGSLTVASSNAAWGAGNYWDGPVAEIMGFSGILTTAQKQLLKRYLNNRYGLSIV